MWLTFVIAGATLSVAASALVMLPPGTHVVGMQVTRQGTRVDRESRHPGAIQASTVHSRSSARVNYPLTFAHVIDF